jgi:hypothetical protein
MTIREQFEGWWGSPLDMVDGEYADTGTADAWRAWQASRAAALEEARKHCGCSRCEDRIKRLATDGSSKGEQE